MWDPDGSGPEPERLVIAGSFTTADGVAALRIAIWNGSKWAAIGGGFNNIVHVVSTWDPDGSGPLPSQLVTGGDFTTADGVTAYRIARWDPLAPGWQALGDGFNFGVQALCVWDSDGDGPLPPRLVAGGRFTVSQGFSVSKVGVWDGNAWQQLGGEIVGPFVLALAAWDPDGDGPLGAQLVAGGDISSAGGTPVSAITVWDGSSWQSLGDGMTLNGGTAVVRALTTWDPDGAGSAPAQLVAGGTFTTAGGVEANRIARWDGQSWHAFDAGFNADVLCLLSRDADGSGSQPAELLAGGTFASANGVPVECVARWEPSSQTWAALGSDFNAGVLSLLVGDLDGEGPKQSLLVGIGPDTAGGVDVHGVGIWDDASGSWRAVGHGLNGSVNAATFWNPDNSKTGEPQLVVGGAMTTAGGYPASRVARWNGSDWQALGSAWVGFVQALCAWDPDGNGEATELVVAGGSILFQGENHRVGSWDGESWSPLGAGMDGDVLALTTWDPDGEGPSPPVLIAGGSFVVSGSAVLNRIARWNVENDVWEPLGPSNAPGLNGKVNALTTWDPDGSGPLASQLVAGGQFTLAGSTVVNRIASWDGFQWHALGLGLPGAGTTIQAWALTSWDPDGQGPAISQLFVGGSFSTAGTVTATNLARWDGSSWSSFGGGTSAVVRSLSTWDPDGNGPSSSRLVIGGGFLSAGGVAVNRAASWDPDDSSWHGFEAGMNSGSVFTIQRVFSQHDQSRPEQLIFGGSFTRSGNLPMGYVALWSTVAPEITEQPQVSQVNPGETVTLRVVAKNGQLTYQWRRGGDLLANGPTGEGSIVYGATGPTLTIANAQPADAGTYDCVISNSCGTAVSNGVFVTVIAPPVDCLGDTNADNEVNGADLSVLLGQFGSIVPPGAGADINGDGVVNAADLSVLLAAFGSAC